MAASANRPPITRYRARTVHHLGAMRQIRPFQSHTHKRVPNHDLFGIDLPKLSPDALELIYRDAPKVRPHQHLGATEFVDIGLDNSLFLTSGKRQWTFTSSPKKASAPTGAKTQPPKTRFEFRLSSPRQALAPCAIRLSAQRTCCL